MTPTDLPTFLSNCLYFDLETHRNQDKLYRIGAQYHSETFERHGKFSTRKALSDLDRFAANAHYVLGHNLLQHDLLVLQKLSPKLKLLQLPVVDTLYLSPLAFPENPYHRLVKDYKLVRSSLNDPVQDAQLSATLFEDQWKQFLHWQETTPNLLTFYRYCFQDFHGLTSVFEALGAAQETSADALIDIFKHHTFHLVCTTELEGRLLKVLESSNRPILSYALAWLRVSGSHSVLPPWVRHRFPEIVEFLKQLRDRPCGSSDCVYCEATHNPRKQLKQLFGFSDFRSKPEARDGSSLQAQIVAHGMQDQSLLALLPTGGGKSLCYQIPALVRHYRRGLLTVVVSPLQALMKDQVDNLASNTGTPFAGAIYGMLTPPERGEILEQLRLGDLAILYIAPEQLRNKSVSQALQQREIGCWVFDEAHCLSKWGHDFRPDYLYAARFIKNHANELHLPTPPVACFTATAKQDVVEEIVDHFQKILGQQLTVFEGGVERTNLRYEVQKVNRAEKWGRIHEILSERLPSAEGSALIYTATRRGSENLATYLEQQDYVVAAFHAGLTAPVKRKIQNAFIAGEIPVICATNAFGMGIDKPDIRIVIHADIPGSLENYLQEAGRAGRDLQEAECILLYDEADIETQFQLEAVSEIGHRDIAQILRGLKLRAKRKHTDEVVITSGELLRDDQVETTIESDDSYADTKVKTAVAWLERTGYLERNENQTRVFQGKSLLGIEEIAEKLNELNLAPPVREQWEAIIMALINADPDQGISTDELAELPAFKKPSSLPDNTSAPSSPPGKTSSPPSRRTNEETDTQRVLRVLHEMSDRGLLKKGIQLTAYLRPKGPHNARSIFEKRCALDRAMLNNMEEANPDADDGEWQELNLTKLNQRLLDEGFDCAPEILQSLLRSLSLDGKGLAARRGSLEIHHISRNLYKVKLQRSWQALVDTAERRREVASLVLETLLNQVPKDQFVAQDVLVEFSSDDIVQALRQDLILQTQIKDELAAIDRGLMFLHEQQVISLQKGLAVFSQAMTIHLFPEARSRRYSKRDYEPLAHHYEERVFQVHVMNEYAKLGLEKLKQAFSLVLDYFDMEKSRFMQEYFSGKKEVVKRATSQLSYQRIVEDLNNSDQQKIVTRPLDENILILAGPGSGKTRVVVHRCAYLLRVKRVSPHCILVLCFNRNAAITLRHRLRELVEEESRRVTILTYHALAMHLTGVSLVQRAEDHQDTLPFDQIIKNAVALLRGEQNLPGVDADDLRERLLAGYQFILVDEYQDIDQDQYDLISALAGRTLEDPDAKLSILAVGDDDQNIYTFRGANVGFIRQFSEDYEAQTYYLVENYRSTQPIIDAANHLIASNQDRMKTDHPIRINLSRKDAPSGGPWSQEDFLQKGRIVVYEVENGVHQAWTLVQVLQQLKSQNSKSKWRDFAVLSRTRGVLFSIRTVCERQEIPFVWGMDREKMPALYHIREIATFLDWLKPRKNDILRASQLKQEALSTIPTEAANTWHQLLLDTLEAYSEETGDTQLPISRAIDFIYEYLAEQRREHKIGAGVFLSTVHAAKGLEFPHVLIPDGGWNPGKNSSEQEEERRIFYVALTRAQYTLHVFQRKDGVHPHLELLRKEPTPEFLHVTSPAYNPSQLEVIPPLRYEVIGLKDLFLSFAGWQDRWHPIHRRLSMLEPGNLLSLHPKESTTQEIYLELHNSQNYAVARLSKQASETWAVKLPNIQSIRLIAVIRRTHQEGSVEFRDRAKTKMWEVPVVEVIYLH